MSLPSRRSIIAAAASIASAGLAGCSAAPLGRQSTPECDEMHEAVVKTQEVSLSSAKREEVDLIQYSDLPDGEKAIVRTAIEEKRYHKCPSTDPIFPDALYSFEDRVSRHTNENHHAYLSYSGATYAVAVRIEDEVTSWLPDRQTITQDR
ncbi:MAG: hypothetical protein ABEH81_06730 [Halopenitus sp.]